MQSFPWSFPFQLIALAIFINLWNAEAVRPPKTVIVNKCCATGEKFSENHECIIENNNDWWPLIVMVLKQAYFEPRGNAPRFIKSRTLQPLCEKPIFYIGPHKMALFSNGPLYLLEKHKFIEPRNFCIDRDSAIVCDPDTNLINSVHKKKIAKIRKCCGKNAVYKTSDSFPCVPINGYEFNYTQYDVVYGFPECKVNKYIKIAETFKESSLHPDSNRLVLDTGRELDWQDFCVEHNVIENNTNENTNDITPYIRVFTCADHLSVSQNTKEYAYTVNKLNITFIILFEI